MSASAPTSAITVASGSWSPRALSPTNQTANRAAAALALFAVGLVGESALGLQEPLATVIALVGALALTLLESGRL